MLELLDRIETLLKTEESQIAPSQPDPMPNTNCTSKDAPTQRHPLTSWDTNRIIQALTEKLPASKGPREKEAWEALRGKKYSRCQIYPKLVDDNAYIAAVDQLSRIPAAIKVNPLSLPAIFKQSAHAIQAAHDQRIRETTEASDKQWAKQSRNSTVAQLEKLAIDVFARGLGDTAEQ